MSRIRQIVFFFALILSTSALFAQSEPQFFIEKIDVRGTRFTSSNVVRKQTLLHEGSTYTEPQLKAAIDRINRLPFVIDAEFALEKGSEREHYVLVVKVSETKPLFVNADSRKSFSDSGCCGTHDFEQNTVEGGVRGFVGSTLLHASSNFKGVYEAGITQYDLFGTAAFASLRVRWSDRRIFADITPPSGFGDPFHVVASNEPSPDLIVGVPIVGNHSIRAHWTRTGYKSTNTTTIALPDGVTEKHFDREESTNDFGDVAWVFDSTDDALLPTRGNLVRTGLFFSYGTQTRSHDDSAPIDSTIHSRAVFLEGRHYWELPAMQSVSVGADIARTRLTSPDAPFPTPSSTNDSYAAVASYSASLWPRKQTVRFGDLRFEATGRYFHYEGYAPDPYVVTGEVTLRNPWGLLHLILSYNGQGNS